MGFKAAVATAVAEQEAKKHKAEVDLKEFADAITETLGGLVASVKMNAGIAGSVGAASGKQVTIKESDDQIVEACAIKLGKIVSKRMAGLP